jgi:galactokinase
MNIQSLKDLFGNLYSKEGNEPDVFFAPGRVNLIGEHTDYNGGYVLPCALTYGTYLLIRKNKQKSIKMTSENFDYSADIPIGTIRTKRPGKWFNYPLGVMNQLIERGFKPEGMDLLFSGNIPNSAGLSSSASIEMVTAAALNDIFHLGFDLLDLIKISKQAENEFIGVNCGIMDMFAIGAGKKNQAVFLNCATLDYDLIPLELGEYKIVIANTNKSRSLADSKYNERVAECVKAVEQISKYKNITQLGEVSYQEFVDLSHHISDITIRKRAKHVVSEDQRVLDAVIALKKGNLEQFGKLMNVSHNSLRYDYEVTGNELDVMVEEARQVEGVLGARMTGAGFGGCAVALVRADAIDKFISRVGECYQERTGLQAVFYVSEAGDGVRKIGKFDS